MSEAVRDELGRVLCCHGRPFSCDECGEEYAAELLPKASSSPSALAIAEQLKTLEHRLLKEEQVLLGEISAIKRRHREPQAGSPRSYELEDIRRELRKVCFALLRAGQQEKKEQK